MNKNLPVKRYVRHTAFGRLARDVNLLLAGPHQALLRSPEYLEGLIRQRSNTVRALNLFFFGSVGASILLSASSGGYNLDLSALGVSLNGLKITSDVLCLVTALIFGLHFIYFYNFCVIETVLGCIYAQFPTEVRPLLYLHRAADNAFALLVLPRAIGLRSGFGHVILSLAISLAIVVVYIAMLVAVVWSILNYALPVFHDGQLTFSDSVGWFCCLVAATGLLSILTVILPLRYVPASFSFPLKSP